VFAPALVGDGAHEPAPRAVAAAVLAPTTDDGAAVTSTKPRGIDTTDVLVAVLVAAAGIGCVAAARRRPPARTSPAFGLVEGLPRARRGPPAFAA
jgi:hypothetical protein